MPTAHLGFKKVNDHGRKPEEHNSGQEHTAYYHVDHLGTPQNLSYENGDVAWCAENKTWGETQVVISKAAKEASTNNPISFQGQYADEESGLHLQSPSLLRSGDWAVY